MTTLHGYVNVLLLIACSLALMCLSDCVCVCRFSLAFASLDACSLAIVRVFPLFLLDSPAMCTYLRLISSGQ